MTLKQPIKLSEARILVFLETSDQDHHFAKRMSHKLNMDYVYLIRTLAGLNYKNWVTKKQKGQKVFYLINGKAPLQEAKELMTQKKKQHTNQKQA